MTTNHGITLRQTILDAADQFTAAGLEFAQGMPEAIDEAVYLGLSALEMPLDVEDAAFDRELNRDELSRVQDFYRQRIELRKPACYITNRAMFAGREYYVDERVLIPRSPFAELIDNRFQPWLSGGKVGRILDLCTGSGCIAIACAHAFPEAEVVASDVSADALQVAEINIERHGVSDRVTLIESDLFDSIEAGEFDLIVSNPPYVSKAEMQELASEFDHEPALGLVAGDDGLDLVIPMLQQARSHLADQGSLFVEVGYSWPILQQAFPSVPFMWMEFDYGGEGVFTLTANELDDHATALASPTRQLVEL